MIPWNPNVKLILADVDDTIAAVYTPAADAMIIELNKLLKQGIILFLVSGGGLQSIRERIVDRLTPELRHLVLIAHCSGAEVWGFQKGGEINSEPFYSLYEGHFNDTQKHVWRQITNQLIEQYQLKVYSTRPREFFRKDSNNDPLSIMLADRGPQITFEFTNSINLTPEQKDMIENKLHITIPQMHGTFDLRYPIFEDAKKAYTSAHLPVHPQFGGIFALDHVINGVDKTKAVRHVLSDPHILDSLGLKHDELDHSSEIEIWGDKFSQVKNGPDFEICKAVSPDVRTIDFRQETELPQGYNIHLWDGKNHLYEGLLEYLQQRPH